MRDLSVFPRRNTSLAILFLGTEKKSHDNQKRDRILRLFLRPDIGQSSPHFGAIFLLNYTKNLEKEKKKSTGENSHKKNSGDSAPKLQISVPCRGRTRPDEFTQKLYALCRGHEPGPFCHF